MIPALTMSSLNLPIAASISVLGMTPASVSSLALTITMNRIITSRVSGNDVGVLPCRSSPCCGFPQTHHAALGVGEERKESHTGYGLLLDMDLAAGSDDLVAV